MKKATPSKNGTPSSSGGGGLFAFGFTKKPQQQQTTTPSSSASAIKQKVEIIVGEESVFDETPMMASASTTGGSSSSSMLGTSDGNVSTIGNSKRTTALPVVNSIPSTASSSTLSSASSPELDNAISPVKQPLLLKAAAVSDEKPSVVQQKKRRIVLDEESDEEPQVTRKPIVEAREEQEQTKKSADKRKLANAASTPAKRKTPAKKNGSDSEVSEVDEDSDDSEDSDDEEDEDDDEVISSKKKKGSSSAWGSSSKKSTASGGEIVVKAGVYSVGEHEHDQLAWFQERKDAALRLPTHVDYDPSTLLVPPGYREGKPAFHSPRGARKITDAMCVWWDFYSRNADCVLAFKVGKFYELYHQCADIAVRCCDLLYMRGETAHCGFPEAAWSKNMSKLVNANFRVARVEQTETPDEMQQRTGKKSGMVRREVCQVLSPGTMTLSVRDCGDGFIPRADGRVQLLSVIETDKEIGVCLLDATTGKFRLGQFANDVHRIGLRACLAFETPAEIVYARGSLSSDTLAILRAEANVLHTCLPPRNITEDWSRYFPADSTPTFLATLPNQVPLGNQALVNCVRVLRRALVDDELITMGRFSRYNSPSASVGDDQVSMQQENVEEENQDDDTSAVRLKMDAQALSHLEIVANAIDGTREGTLLEYLDRTKSSFGARLFKEWVTRPLASISHIIQRQTALGCIMTIVSDSALSEFRRALQSSPDVERNLSKIHAIGLAKKADHPDTRAVIFGADQVNKNKIETLCATLNSLRNLRIAGEKLSVALSRANIPDQLKQAHFLMRILRDLSSPQSLKLLDSFEQSFDSRQAKKTGIIEPRDGVSPRYDEARAGVTEAKNELNNYLATMKKQLNCQMTYFTPATGKQIYQIEVPETKKVPDNWTVSSKRKGFKRYTTAQQKQLVLQLERAELGLSEASKDVSRAVFAEFDKNKAEWLKLARASAEMDCLIALTLVSCETDEICTPEFVASADKQPFLELSHARHPCVAAGLDRLGKNSFIPNDTFLNGERGRCLLLTGPNMGGKSTLLRQTCLAVIVAQIGCKVQAQSYRGTIVDAIFTRVGASDRILEGQSTFFVELSETANILRSATRDSLVILDELGRGTSTFDGTAIAHAVINKLLSTGCRTMFATHYHSLVREVGRSAGVSLGHMACVADCDPNDADKQDVTFLYKLVTGASDRSYGLNVARLARLPEDIIQRANVMSQKFERAFERHLRIRLLQEMKDLAEKGQVQQLRLAIKRAECFVV